MPVVYDLLRKTYYLVRPQHLKEILYGTEVREKEWALRHLRGNKIDDWGNGNDDWIKGYWNSKEHPHRHVLVEKIASFEPFSSILEIGCNSGPNLALLAKRFNSAEIKGIDINPKAIEMGKEWLAKENISNVELIIGKADNLEGYPDKCFDVIFTDAALIYVGPDKITNIMKEVVRIARKALIFIEWHRFDSKGTNKETLGVYNYGLWKRDYLNLLKRFVPKENIKIEKITEDVWPDEGWKNHGAFVEVVFD
jgi:ubiquinone/menaquinone biosynthesis C-methylase UbiE